MNRKSTEAKPDLRSGSSAQRHQSPMSSFSCITPALLLLACCQPAPVPADDSLSILVRLRPDDPQPELLQVQTPLRNFEQRIEVTDESTSPPTPLCQPALFFDYSQFMDVRRTETALRKSSTRLLKIRIAAAPKPPQAPAFPHPEHCSLSAAE